MSQAFYVVPQALRDAAKLIDQMADNWGSAARIAEQSSLHEKDLGILGEQADFVTRYNDAQSSAADTLKEGSVNLRDWARTLDKVADVYEAKDTEYYEKFNYIAVSAGLST